MTNFRELKDEELNTVTGGDQSQVTRVAANDPACKFFEAKAIGVNEICLNCTHFNQGVCEDK